MDPDIRRSMKVRTALQNSIKCYQDLYKENYKKDQLIKNKDSEFQKVSNIVQDMSENETNADKMKSALGIPVTNVVSFDSLSKR